MARVVAGAVDMMRAVLQWLGNFFTRNSWAIGVLGLVAGLVTGIGVPLWKSYWVETPSLSVEINAISREVSKSVRITLEDYSEFAFLATGGRRLVESEDFNLLRWRDQVSSAGVTGVTLEQLGRLIENAKREAKELPNTIPERKRQLAEVEALNEEQLNLQKARQLNVPLSQEVNFAPTDLERKRENVLVNKSYFRDLLVQFKEKYQERVTALEKRAQDLEQKLPSAERRFDTLKSELLQTRSTFAVTAAFTNSGRSSISIKRVGLLRVYIGAGNYVDIR